MLRKMHERSRLTGNTTGKRAQKLVEGVRAQGGNWTMADLANYKVIEREPLRFDYRGVHIVTASPPSAGKPGRCRATSPTTTAALARAAGAVAALLPFELDGQHGVALTCPADAPDRAGAVALRHAVAVAAPGLDLAVRVRPLAAPALIVMDMDSTILAIEVIDELARRHGVGAEVAAVTERAMRGELDFAASLRERVATLRGVPVSALEEVRSAVRVTRGVPELIAATVHARPDAMCASTICEKSIR